MKAYIILYILKTNITLTLRVELIISVSFFLTFSGQERSLFHTHKVEQINTKSEVIRVSSKETEFYYFNSRYYSPKLCRWISPDSVDYLDPESINGLNLYCYCMNNPIMYANPSGHSAILIGLIIGAIIGFGTAAYIDYQDDGQIFNESVA